MYCNYRIVTKYTALENSDTGSSSVMTYGLPCSLPSSFGNGKHYVIKCKKLPNELWSSYDRGTCAYEN